MIVYNAKAHPHLSIQGELLISYDVNLWGGIPFSTEIYRPGFVILKLDELPKEQPKSTAKNNVALGKSATASHGNTDAHKAINGKWHDIKADKWSGASLGN